MAATIVDGKAIAQQIRADVAREVAAFTERTGAPPGLATVLVGDDPASDVYISGKQRASAEVGIEGFDHRLPAESSQEEVAGLLRRLPERVVRIGVEFDQLVVPALTEGADGEPVDVVVTESRIVETGARIQST